ncbi:MAG: B12-binding domain-containing radical SAM protein [Deltaproteobacteria bacterium]|nr:B12-binding domain-containing radical SAM protein [Deltaproteobacteria bacterium]
MPLLPRRTVALVGAEHGENLSLRYLAAAVHQLGFEPLIVACNAPEDHERAIEAVLASDALLCGLSLAFQVRAAEMLGFASELRARGFAGHICVGGHFATLEHEALLRGYPAVDSVVRHDGEQTLGELCELLCDDRPLRPLAGLAVREGDTIVTGPPRAAPQLDALAFPLRSSQASLIFDVKGAPLVASRGCYGDCAFCCIHAYNSTALGPRVRMRSMDNVVAEMKQEYHQRGIRLFVFHDDNFFVPSLRANLDRCRALHRSMREAGLVDVALVLKCRPNDVDVELFRLLREMGLVRVYVGVETQSSEGILSLSRRIGPHDNARALGILAQLGIYHSFNLLLFHPEATLEGVAVEVDFLADHAEVPFNFGRVEVYAGTPLHQTLSRQGRLRGSFLSWTYEIRDPKVELLFRIASFAFRTRNSGLDDVANLNASFRLEFEVFERFHPELVEPGERQSLAQLSREIGSDTVARLREAIDFVRDADPSDNEAISAFTLALGRRISAADMGFLSALRGCKKRLEMRVAAAGGPREYGRAGPSCLKERRSRW